MPSGARAADWTEAWRHAGHLALSSWTRRADALRSPGSAGLLESALTLQCLGSRLVLHGYVLLPGALHLVAGRRLAGEAEPLLDWPTALGRIKGLHARWDNRRRSTTGSVWREGIRLRPLDRAEALRAVESCHLAPVRAGLVRRPDDWPWSSWRRIYRERHVSFVRPLA